MISKRSLCAALLLGGLATSVSAQAPAPYEATPELVEAAKKEGKAVWYTATDVQVSEKAGAAFEAFSPSHKREYIDWITEARTEATRTRRLETAVGWMAEGKPRNWKYTNC